MDVNTVITTPPQMVLAGTPFQKQVPGTSAAYTASVDDASIDNIATAVASKVAAALGATAPTPINVDTVAKTLTQAQILQALQARIAAGGN